MTKPTKWPLRPAKTQISLGIRPVWSESSLCAQWVAKDPSFLHADSEDSDQTGRMPRLIWVFAGRICHFAGFVMTRLIYYKTHVYTNINSNLVSAACCRLAASRFWIIISTIITLKAGHHCMNAILLWNVNGYDLRTKVRHERNCSAKWRRTVVPSDKLIPSDTPGYMCFWWDFCFTALQCI